MTTKPFRPLPETVPDRTFPELPPRNLAGKWRRPASGYTWSQQA